MAGKTSASKYTHKRCDPFIHFHPLFALLAPWLAPSLSSHRRVPMILLTTQRKAVIAKSSLSFFKLRWRIDIERYISWHFMTVEKDIRWILQYNFYNITSYMMKHRWSTCFISWNFIQIFIHLNADEAELKARRLIRQFARGRPGRHDTKMAKMASELCLENDVLNS